MRSDQSSICLSCQNAGQRRKKKKDFVTHSTFSMYTVFTGHCSDMDIGLLERLRAFEKAC